MLLECKTYKGWESISTHHFCTKYIYPIWSPSSSPLTRIQSLSLRVNLSCVYYLCTIHNIVMILKTVTWLKWWLFNLITLSLIWMHDSVLWFTNSYAILWLTTMVSWLVFKANWMCNLVSQLVWMCVMNINMYQSFSFSLWFLVI